MAQKSGTGTLEPGKVEAIVRDWFRFYSEKNFEAHNALIHPEAVVVYPEMSFVKPDMAAGKDFLVRTLEKDKQAFIDLKMEIDNVWVAGNSAFVEGHFVGTTLGGPLADKIKGSGMRLRFLDRIDIQDGMVKLVHAYYDTALFYQVQLGLEAPTMENPMPPWMIAMGGTR